jgi:ComF family protein
MSWLNYLHREATGLLDLLLPESCPVCDHPAVLQPEGLCCECLKQIVPVPASHCPRCSLPYPGFSPAPHLCGRCSQQPPAFVSVATLGLYQGTLQCAVQRLKYRRKPILDLPLGRLLAQIVNRQDFSCSPDLIVPVPLHRQRLRERGFNQSQLLARELSRHCRIRLDGKLLERTRATPPQQNLSAEKRRQNLRGSMKAKRQLSGEHILLVDDVLTTGATADVCARSLLLAGAGQVSVAVLARAQLHFGPS